MPNRIIKESICISEQIDELSPFEETFFYRLLVNCDDYGCMDAREKVLAAKLYPLRVIRGNEIMKAVRRLAQIGLIMTYETAGKPYLKVIKWADHQRVRVSKHKYPEPTEEQIAASCGDSRQVAASCGKLRPESNPIQSNPNPYPNPNPNPNPTRAREERTDDLFSAFWEAYPRKESKPAARKAFDKLKPNAELLGKMLQAISKWRRSSQWQEDGGQYIPYPASWINQRKWEDEPPAAKPKQVQAANFEQRDYSDVPDDDIARMAAEIREMKAREEGII